MAILQHPLREDRRRRPLAYQVVGDGPVDILFVLGWVTHIERIWTEPRFARFFTRLSSLARVMLFEKRGVELSDRVPEDRRPPLEGADGRRPSRDGRRRLRARGGAGGCRRRVRWPCCSPRRAPSARSR